MSTARKEFRVYGSGGQGSITLGHLIGSAAILDGNEAALTEEYSPYITGGWSRADIVISTKEIDYPMVEEPDYLVALNQEGYDENRKTVGKKCKILVDTTFVKVADNETKKVIDIKGRAIAEGLKSPNSANVVMFGLLAGVSGMPTKASAIKAIERRFPKYKEVNIKAFEEGFRRGETVG